MSSFTVSQPAQTPPSGALSGLHHDVAVTVTAQFVVRRDATSRSDGRVTDVLTTSAGATRQPAVFLANPTAGPIEPAALAEFCRRAVAAGAPIYDDPHDVLSRLGDLIAVHHPGVYMTALFGSLEQQDHRITVCIANRGHVLPLVVSAGSVRPIGLHGTVLGETAHSTRQRALSRVVLGVGDQLVLINDRPSDTPIPQPHRAEIVRSRPFGLSDHDLAAHVIDLYDNASVDVIVISARSADRGEPPR